MRHHLKLISLIVVVVLVVSSVYVLFFIGNEDEKVDNKPPTIDFVTGDTTGTTGKITTIFVTFSDNINVTNATIYYKSESEDSWSSVSILSGRADFKIPSNPVEDWYYYVTVNDATGNGPVGDPSDDGSVYYMIDVTRNKLDLVHKVFLEGGTATYCTGCPKIEQILHELYDPNDPDFYYVSLVSDKNSEAEKRLKDDYNLYGFPTVFFDGGFETCCIDIDPEMDKKEAFKEKINKIASRDVPDLYLNVSTKWDDDEKELVTDVIVENLEDETYSGTLKVYITEINSRWSNQIPYHYAFLDYSINKKVTIEGNSDKTFSGKWDVSSSGYSKIYPENLWVVAVLFNSESIERYSDPPENEHPFEAHYADAADGAKVANGTLPPVVAIGYPQQRYRYIFGKEFGRPLINGTVIFGKITLKINFEAEAGVEKVEYIVKGPLREIKETFTEEPYEWTWHKLSFGKYTITVNLYDKEGRTATDSLEVYAFML